MELAALARERVARGEPVVDLTSGDPDFDTPAHIQAAATRAMARGDTHYPPARGTAALVEAIVDRLSRANGIVAEPSQVIVTPGAKWAMFLALAAILEPGDEVVVPEPAWVSYAPMVTLNGGVPRPLPLSGADRWAIHEGALRDAMSPRTAAILLNSPSNPTGHVAPREELEGVARVAASADAWIVSDEIYEPIRFDGRAYTSIGTLPEAADRTITVNGFSKAYAMTGWRLGYLVGPREVVEAALSLQMHAITAAASVTMAAGLEALTGPQDCVEEMVDAYDRRRRFFVEALNGVSDFACPSPEGAFYVFPSVASALDSVALAARILDETGVAVVPGAGFGAAGAGHLRMTLAAPMSELERAAERLAHFRP